MKKDFEERIKRIENRTNPGVLIFLLAKNYKDMPKNKGYFIESNGKTKHYWDGKLVHEKELENIFIIYDSIPRLEKPKWNKNTFPNNRSRKNNVDNSNMDRS
jgi:hypothetical protein